MWKYSYPSSMVVHHYLDTKINEFLFQFEVDDSSAFTCRLVCRGVYEKIFCGIQETKSLRVIVASFRLLHDLDLVSISSLEQNGHL